MESRKYQQLNLRLRQSYAARKRSEPLKTLKKKKYRFVSKKVNYFCLFWLRLFLFAVTRFLIFVSKSLSYRWNRWIVG